MHATVRNDFMSNMDTGWKVRLKPCSVAYLMSRCASIFDSRTLWQGPAICFRLAFSNLRRFSARAQCNEPIQSLIFSPSNLFGACRLLLVKRIARLKIPDKLHASALILLVTRHQKAVIALFVR